ncbi:aa3-type cytochrome c oxidase subunit IV [Glycocaulis abyssi]|uniref:Aa3-type cytochrome c oxidase subunit IV n=1 Tax=Glycocaulis abyssi TaxID=1433403 RepID=A0ABV9NDQ4_9PROT
MASDYTRGEMDISEQHGMFVGVMKAGVSCTLILTYSIVFLTFAFATGTGWFTSLGIALAVGVIGGVIMKQGPWYWLTTGVLTVLTGIIGLAIAVFAG